MIKGSSYDEDLHSRHLPLHDVFFSVEYLCSIAAKFVQISLLYDAKRYLIVDLSAVELFAGIFFFHERIVRGRFVCARPPPPPLFHTCLLSLPLCPFLSSSFLYHMHLLHQPLSLSSTILWYAGSPWDTSQMHSSQLHSIVGSDVCRGFFYKPGVFVQCSI